MCAYMYIILKQLEIPLDYALRTPKVLDMVARDLPRIEKFDGLGNEGFVKTF